MEQRADQFGTGNTLAADGSFFPVAVGHIQGSNGSTLHGDGIIGSVFPAGEGIAHRGHRGDGGSRKIPLDHSIGTVQTASQKHDVVGIGFIDNIAAVVGKQDMIRIPAVSHGQFTHIGKEGNCIAAIIRKGTLLCPVIVPFLPASIGVVHNDVVDSSTTLGGHHRHLCPFHPGRHRFLGIIFLVRHGREHLEIGTSGHTKFKFVVNHKVFIGYGLLPKYISLAVIKGISHSCPVEIVAFPVISVIPVKEPLAGAAQLFRGINLGRRQAKA